MHEYDMKTHIKIHSNLCLSTSPHSIIACPQAIIPVPNQNKFSSVLFPPLSDTILTGPKLQTFTSALILFRQIYGRGSYL